MSKFKTLEEFIDEVYRLARKNWEQEVIIDNNIDTYFRVCYDKEYDKWKRKLSSYISLKDNTYFMSARHKNELLNILFINNIKLKQLKFKKVIYENN